MCLLTLPLSASADPTSGNPTSGNPTSGNPTSGNPTSGNPTSGNPTSGNPTSGNPTSGDPTSGDSAMASPAETSVSQPASPTPTPGATSSSTDPELEPGSGSAAAATTPPEQRPVQTPTATARAEASETSSISLTVTATGTPVARHFFEDTGSYTFSGAVGADDATATVSIYRRATAATWTKVAEAASDADGAFRASVPVTDRGAFTFAATVGGSPTTTTASVSNPVEVTVEDATVTMNKIVGSIDSLVDPTVTGRVAPARAGVTIIVEVLTSGKFVPTATTTTTAAGTYAVKIAYGHGNLATYQVRARWVPANRPTRVEATGPQTFKRIAVINAVVTRTTAARGEDLSGRLSGRTVEAEDDHDELLRLRQADASRRDRRPEDLTTRVVRGFSSALAHRYPIAKMNNPDVYDGNDPKQMAADNTSGFNCRKVVGNPYQMSPHSYGIAIDVNTVRNPYRDSKGKWWPANGKKYIKRTPKSGEC